MVVPTTKADLKGEHRRLFGREMLWSNGFAWFDFYRALIYVVANDHHEEAGGYNNDHYYETVVAKKAHWPCPNGYRRARMGPLF